MNIYNNWNLRRALYLIGGLFFLAISIMDRTWWMAIFGLYFASMALFNKGCAGGNCSSEVISSNNKNNNNVTKI